jgi:hypothetical protein
MGKAVISIEFVTLRPDGLGGFRPRYVPGKRHRGLGLKGQDLRHGPDGPWFSLDECAAWSAKHRLVVAELEAAKTPRGRRAVVSRAAGLTVAELFERWWREPRMRGELVVEGRKERRPLEKNTVDYYKAGAKRLEELDGGRVWFSPAAAVSAAVLGHEENGVLHRIEVERGLHVARCVRAALSACYAFGVRKHLVPANPVRGLEYDMPVPAARVRYGSIAEMRHLVRAADLLVTTHGQTGEATRRYADIGDAIVLGLWTGQRQSDRLALVDGQRIGDEIVFRQHKKHGQPLLIPAGPELLARLAAIRERRHDWRVNYPHVVLNEEGRKPFTAFWYRHCFGRVRAAAVKGIHVDGTLGDGPNDRGPWLLEPCASLSDFHDQDLRDTAVTWLALAGATKPEIASITGHSLASVDEILKHYLGLHPDLARSAIGKLVAWYDQQGENNG